MSRNYYEIIDDLNKGVMNKAVAARAKKAIMYDKYGILVREV